jgi:delta(3,5)-delta(2,4)-dienoyl-CoA isomerase
VTAAGIAAATEGETDVARKAYKMHAWLRDLQDCLTAMEDCDRPIVAAVHSIAYGLAVDLLCCVDVRFAEEGARFCIKVRLSQHLLPGRS